MTQSRVAHCLAHPQYYDTRPPCICESVDFPSMLDTIAQGVASHARNLEPSSRGISWLAVGIRQHTIHMRRSKSGVDSLMSCLMMVKWGNLYVYQEKVLAKRLQGLVLFLYDLVKKMIPKCQIKSKSLAQHEPESPIQ